MNRVSGLVCTLVMVLAFGAGAGEQTREMTARQVDLDLPEMPVAVARADAAWIGDDVGVVIDGSFEDWPDDVAWIDVGSLEDPADLSGRVAVGISARGLYLAADLHDDTHWNREGGERIWMGDSVQFAIDPMGDRAADGYAWDDHEIGVALTATGPFVWRWQRPRVYPLAEIRCPELAVARDDAAGTTRYELGILYAELYPLEPAILPWCGFTVALNDGDGGRRDASLAWAPGLSGVKNPSLFGVLQFPADEIRRATAYAVRLEGPTDPVLADIGEIWRVSVYANEAYTNEEFAIGVSADVETGPAVGTCWWTAATTMPRGISRWMLAPDLTGIAPARMRVDPKCMLNTSGRDEPGSIRLSPGPVDLGPPDLLREPGLVTHVYE